MIALRKCTGCIQMIEKNKLIRVVRTENKTFNVDLTGKQEGRGAYVCKSLNCVNRAEKIKGFERSFKSPIPKQIYAEIKEIVEGVEGNGR